MVETSIEAIKQEWAKGDDLRDAGLEAHPDDIIRFDSISYGTHGVDNLLDIYMPKEKQTSYPVIFNIHGGGYFYGDKERYQFYGMELARHGFGIVNINYRLAPENQFPAALADIMTALQWLTAHAADYQLDLTRAFLVGDSAGSQMAEQLLVILTNDSYRELFSFPKVELNFKAAGLNSGLYFLTDPEVINEALFAYFGNDPIRRYGQLLKAEDYINDQFPPVYIQAANDDMPVVLSSSKKLHQLLDEKGLLNEFHVVGDEDHPEKHVFHLDLNDPLGQASNQAEIDFFRQQIK